MGMINRAPLLHQASATVADLNQQDIDGRQGSNSHGVVVCTHVRLFEVRDVQGHGFSQEAVDLAVVWPEQICE